MILAAQGGVELGGVSLKGRRMGMADGLGKKISAGNQLRGTVEEVVLGTVTAKVTVRVGENLIESVITRQSV